MVGESGAYRRFGPERRRVLIASMLHLLLDISAAASALRRAEREKCHTHMLISSRMTLIGQLPAKGFGP